VTDGLDQMAPFVAVTAFGQWSSTCRQMPFDAVAFAAGAHLAARPYNRPPENALRGWRSLCRFRLRR